MFDTGYVIDIHVLNLHAFVRYLISFQNFVGEARRFNVRGFPGEELLISERDYLQTQSRYVTSNSDWSVRPSVVNLPNWQFGRHYSSSGNHSTAISDRQRSSENAVNYDVMTSGRMRYNNSVYRLEENIDNRVYNPFSQNKDNQEDISQGCQRVDDACPRENARYCVKTPYCGLLNSYARETEKSVYSTTYLMASRNKPVQEMVDQEPGRNKSGRCVSV